MKKKCTIKKMFVGIMFCVGGYVYATVATQSSSSAIDDPLRSNSITPDDTDKGASRLEPNAINEINKKNKNNNNESNEYEHSSNKYASTQKDDLNLDKVVLNFVNADIQSVIKAISKLSGKNFVIDPRVKGTVNIVSDKPVSKSESYIVLASALRMQGFATVESNGVIKVIPEADAKTYGMSTENSSFEGKRAKFHLGDDVITKIFVIEHGSASQMSTALRPFISSSNSLSVYASSNALIVTDYASNMNRLSKIIHQLTSTGSTHVNRPLVLTLRNAVAADVAPILQSYLNGGSSSSSGSSSGGADGPNTTIVVESATNSIILYSPIRDKLEELKALALKLDENLGKFGNNLHVVYLRNADAVHVAEVLRSIANNQENPDLAASSSIAKFSAEPTSTFNAGSTGSSSGTSSLSSSRSSNSSSASRGYGSNSSQKDAPKILIQAEPTTNALIIQAPQAVYKSLRMVIDMLDIRRVQVMIEAMVAEVNKTASGAFGIQWILGAGNNNIGAIGAGNYGGNGTSLSSIGTSVAAAGSALSGGGSSGAASGISLPNEVLVGLVSGTTTIGGQKVPSLGALADAIQASSAGNVLSRPTLIALDNEEARIQVGQNVGVPNGSYQNTAASAGNLVTTITRTDLGSVLQFKPLVTQNGTIQLDIYQEDSKIDPNQPVNSANGPSFLKRTMRTSILVDDGQIIALGGMTQDTITMQKNGIPGLSSIPYLGWLFSWESRVHSKSNLVLFIRPVIIKNAEGYKALTNQRYSYIMGQQSQVQAHGNLLLPDVKAVTMDNQLPYDVKQINKDPERLNLNQNIPVIDVTNNGANLGKSNPTALSVSNEVVNLNTSPAKATGFDFNSTTPNNSNIANVVDNDSNLSDVKNASITNSMSNISNNGSNTSGTSPSTANIPNTNILTTSSNQYVGESGVKPMSNTSNNVSVSESTVKAM
jgi:general secretion pathway protein D